MRPSLINFLLYDKYSEHFSGTVNVEGNGRGRGGREERLIGKEREDDNTESRMRGKAN